MKKLTLLIVASLMVFFIRFNRGNSFVPSIMPSQIGSTQFEKNVPAVLKSTLNANDESTITGTMSPNQIQACLQLWEKIHQWKEGEIVPPEAGCNRVPAPLGAYHQMYVNNCLRNKTDGTSADCKMALKTYWLESRYYFSKRIELSELSDTGLLKDRVLVELNQDPRGAVKTAERLYELNSDSPAMAKMVLSTRIAETYSKPIPPGDSRWQEFSKRVNELSEVLPEKSDEVLEASALVGVYGSGTLAEAKEAASEWAQAGSKPGLGYYYLAKRAMESGDHNQALSLLNSAVEVEPNEKRYFETLTQIKNQQFHGQLFPYSVNLPNI